MQPEFERGHHAEVAATAAHGPEQIRIVPGAGMAQLSVGRHDVDGLEIVDGHAEAARQPAEPSSEREAAHAGVRDGAERGHEPVRGALVIHLA